MSADENGRGMRFNSMFDVAFSVDHDEADPWQIGVERLIEALEERVRSLKKMPADEAEASFGLCDTYEREVGNDI